MSRRQRDEEGVDVLTHVERRSRAHSERSRLHARLRDQKDLGEDADIPGEVPHERPLRAPDPKDHSRHWRRRFWKRRNEHRHLRNEMLRNGRPIDVDAIDA